MTIGGLAYYNPDLNGFREDNVTDPDYLNGWMDVVEGRSDGYQRDTIDLLLHGSMESGAYGASWASIASNLPANPALGRTVWRMNTDESNAIRIYTYNSSSWVFETMGLPNEEISLDQLTDVTIDGTPADNEFLAWDTSTSEWINQTPAEILYPFDDIGNPDADVNINMANNHLHLTFQAPTTDAGVIFELIGNTEGKDLLHLHQFTGAPQSETSLLHMEWVHTNMVPMQWSDDGGTNFVTFDVEDIDADYTLTFQAATGTIALLETAQTFSSDITFSSDVGIAVTPSRARLEVKDDGMAHSVLVRLTADNLSPFALIIGNVEFSDADNDGLGFWVVNSGDSGNGQAHIQNNYDSPLDLVLQGIGGNIGFGTDDIEDWDSDYIAIEFPQSSILIGGTDNDIWLVSNAYFEEPNTWKRKAANPASAYWQFDGEHYFDVVGTGAADSSFTFINTMKIGIDFVNISGAGTPNLYLRTTASASQEAWLHVGGARGSSTSSDISGISLEDGSESFRALAEIAVRKQTGNTDEGNLIFRTNDGSGTLIEAMRIMKDQTLRLATVNTDVAGGNYLIRQSTVLLERTAANVLTDIGAAASSHGDHVPTDHALDGSTYGYGDAVKAGHLRVGVGIAIDTGTISHPIGSTYEHLPSGGGSGDLLKWNTGDAGQWVAPSDHGDHHTIFSPAEVNAHTDLTATGSQIEDLLAFSSTNKGYMILPLWNATVAGYTRGTNTEITNNDGTDASWNLQVALPLTLGSLTLRVTELQFYIYDADSTNKVTLVRLFGGNASGGETQLYTSGTVSLTTTGLKNTGSELAAMSDVDLGSYNQATVIITNTVADAGGLGVGQVALQFWYE